MPVLIAVTGVSLLACARSPVGVRDSANRPTRWAGHYALDGAQWLAWGGRLSVELQLSPRANRVIARPAPDGPIWEGRFVIESAGTDRARARCVETVVWSAPTETPVLGSAPGTKPAQPWYRRQAGQEEAWNTDASGRERVTAILRDPKLEQLVGPALLRCEAAAFPIERALVDGKELAVRFAPADAATATPWFRDAYSDSFRGLTMKLPGQAASLDPWRAESEIASQVHAEVVEDARNALMWLPRARAYYLLPRWNVETDGKALVARKPVRAPLAVLGRQLDRRLWAELELGTWLAPEPSGAVVTDDTGVSADVPVTKRDDGYRIELPSGGTPKTVQVRFALSGGTLQQQLPQPVRSSTEGYVRATSWRWTPASP